MNIRQINLALTVELMNAQNDNALNLVKELMLTFKEVGRFIGSKLVKKAPLNSSHTHQTYALQFENCRLDLDLVSNQNTNSQYVQRFQLR